ncbi:DUF3168 domain-containing protein [Salipiger abyssi]|uniref:Putative DUF3168 protein n=1 Tax=Salipiger abyssi TaxID=1250539 RepID=A0A1P8UUS5_9RHOB|nr:DUF3168 domain-containing protein [Salipiger abyssi]APZ53139.1 putative DUF3168 protein [Salipiger abyssi]
MSAFEAVQKAIFDALVADAALGALVSDRIFDGRPADAAFPNITFGPAQSIYDEVDCIDGEEHFFQIDVWDRSQGRVINAKRIADAVKAALHGADLSLTDPYALAVIEVTQMRVMQDPDGVTAHGVLSVRALVEWSAT